MGVHRVSSYLRIFTLDDRSRYEVVCMPSSRQAATHLSTRHSLEKTMKRDLTTMRKRQDERKRDREITMVSVPFLPAGFGGLRLRKSYAEIRAS